jgi:cytochrome c biogenesis protein CcmG, thiol:disulfide interchange protein DsbE
MSEASVRYPTYKRVSAAIVLLIFGLWVAYLLLAPGKAAAGTGVAIGAKAPDFELKTEDGKKVKLSDFKGKPVMVNFFATWCTACRKEMPTLQEAYKKYEAQGFVILAVDLNESNLVVQAFREKLNLTFPIVIDENDRVTRLYDIIPLPTSYFVDKEGNVQAKWTGEINMGQLESILKKLL